MKILLIDKFHNIFGGAERAYFDTANVLKNNGHQVAFFSMQHKDNKETKWSKYFVKNVDLRNKDYSIFKKISVAFRIIWNFEAQKKLNALLDEFKPDVVHMHLIYHQLSPSIIWTLKKRNIPMVMTLHDFKHVSPNYNMLVRGKIWEKSPWHCIGDRCVKDSFSKSVICTFEHYFHKLIKTFEKVDVYIAPSKFLAKKYKEKGFSKEILHVPQPLSKNFFKPCKITEEQNQKYPKNYILYFGRLSYEKGLDVLIEAFSKSKAQNLVFVGKGDQKEVLEKLAKELKIEKKVYFVGYKSGEELKSWICNAKATVMASACYENMPYALLEALASGVIVIAANMGGMPERIIDGENGFLYNPKDKNDLIKKINKAIITNKNTISRNAKLSVEDLTYNKYYDNLMKVYNKAIAQHK